MSNPPETGTDLPIELDAQYRVLREEAGWLERKVGFVSVEGPDAVDFLQSQLTNDLDTTECCYAALLDRKAHVTADCRAVKQSDRVLLIAEPDAAAVLSSHLSTYKVGRKVEVGVVDDLRLVSVIGPATRAELKAPSTGRSDEVAALELDGEAYTAIGTAEGVDLVCTEARLDRLTRSLETRGMERVEESAAEIVRIETGEPRFGLELGPEIMPAEAGIVERAVDFEKGCYLGQEPVARLHYKGRPNRLLRGLRLTSPAERGDEIHSPERELGSITSSCISPAHGPIALSILRREAEPGDEVTIGEGRAKAEVVELPFRDPGDLV